MSGIEVEVESFFIHKKEAFSLSSGLTIVVGPNGSGKSSLFLESFAWGGWGKTLRGTDPFEESKETKAIRQVVGSSLSRVKLSFGERALKSIERSKTKSKVIVKTSYQERAETTWERATEAQVEIDTLLGMDFATWRRTHVFSSSDVDRFSMATDADRKRLLEQLLGLGRFELALMAARKDLTDVRKLVSKSSQALAIAQSQSRIEQAHLTEARLDAEPAEPEVHRKVQDIIADRDKAQAEEEELLAKKVRQRERRDEARESLSAIAGQIAAAKRQIASGECEACHRPFEDKADHAKHAARELKRLAVERQTAAELLEGREEKLQKTVEAINNDGPAARVVRLGRELDRAEDYLKARQASHAEALKRIEKAEARVVKAEMDEELLSAELTEVLAEEALLVDVETVLGTKGARALVLTEALEALELSANWLLDRLDNRGWGARLRLRPSRDKKDGGSVEEISLEVEGWGGGHGYKGSSGGERRRVDVALVLAIADLSPNTGLPLLFDEVFDSLDSDGVEAVSELLADLAKDRPIVVLTHSSALADRARGARRITL